jgi:hypothetical protein
MEKYIVSVIFIVLIAITSNYINQHKDDKDKTKVYILSSVLVVLLGAGGFYVYDEFYRQPMYRKELLAQFLRISPEGNILEQ